MNDVKNNYFGTCISLRPQNLPETSFRGIVVLPKCNFSESLFSRTSFPRIVVEPNVIFTNRRSAERRFPKTSFTQTSFCRTLNRPPVYTFVQCACRRAAIKFIGIDVLRLASKICVIIVIEFKFGHFWTWTRWEFVRFEIRDMYVSI